MKYQELLEELKKMQDEKYLAFNKKIVQTNYEMIGIRIPLLRKMAKEISKSDVASFLKHNSFTYYEEVLLYGFVLGTIKDYDLFLEHLPILLENMDNWSVCDSSVVSMKIIYKNRDDFLLKIKQYLKSDKEFTVRFGIVTLLNYYTEDKYFDEIFSLIDSLNSSFYYVKMAAAWLLSICYIKEKEKTLKYLVSKNNLDEFTFSKTIQKIKDSYRVENREKENLEKLKEKRTY